MEFTVIFDWHISVGTIFEVVAILSGGLFFLWGMKSRVDAMSVELASLKKEITKFGDILTTLALQKMEIVQLRGTIDELRRGVGWIVKPPA